MRATASAPYFWVTYATTRSRPPTEKSVSMSGMDLRPGFRKRSNSRPCSRGSRSVMRSENATSDPAADPRPGPTATPLSRDHLM